MAGTNVFNSGGDSLFKDPLQPPAEAAGMKEEEHNRTNQDHLAQTPKQQTPGVRYAGFWMRFWAYLADLIVIGSINRLLVKPVFLYFGWDLSESGMFAPAAIAYAVVFYAYFVFMTKAFGQTLGKMIFGLRVISLEEKKLTWSTVLFREWIGRYISATIWILYAVVGFTEKKQGIHDMFADTTVIHEAESYFNPAGRQGNVSTV